MKKIIQKKRKMKENYDKKRKMEKDFDEECDEFILDGFFLCSSVEEKKRVENTKLEMRRNVNSFFSIFSIIFSLEIIEFFLSEINKNLIKKKTVLVKIEEINLFSEKLIEMSF